MKKLTNLEKQMSAGIKKFIADNNKTEKQMIFGVFPDNDLVVFKPLLLDENNKVETTSIKIKGVERKDFSFTEMIELLLGKNVMILHSILPVVEALIPKKQKDVNERR